MELKNYTLIKLRDKKLSFSDVLKKKLRMFENLNEHRINKFSVKWL